MKIRVRCIPARHGNPWFDPFVEAGYRGCSLKAAARRGFDRTYTVTLEIRDNHAGALLYERTIEELFSDADTAFAHAMGLGRRLVDELWCRRAPMPTRNCCSRL